MGLTINNCGTGAGGFKPGNKCARGGLASKLGSFAKRSAIGTGKFLGGVALGVGAFTASEAIGKVNPFLGAASKLGLSIAASETAGKLFGQTGKVGVGLGVAGSSVHQTYKDFKKLRDHFKNTAGASWGSTGAAHPKDFMKTWSKSKNKGEDLASWMKQRGSSEGFMDFWKSMNSTEREAFKKANGVYGVNNSLSHKLKSRLWK